MNRLSFATFDLLRETPNGCTLCGSRPPALNYELQTGDESREQQTTTGFCCADCAAQLLGRLESTESREWAEEEAALAADDLDITGFEKRRLAAFEQHSGAGR